MGFAVFLLPLAVVVAWSALNLYSGFRKNLAKVRACGIQQVNYGPIYLGLPIGQIILPIIMPMAAKLPKAWTDSWHDVSLTDWSYANGWDPFEKRKTEWITMVSPLGIYMSIVNPDVIAQITERRNDFTKPIEVYDIVDKFGKNLVTTEGDQWRQQRKIASPAFSEKNNALVWDESLRQVKCMLENWEQVPGNGSESVLVTKIQASTTELALHIISRAAFGIRMLWSHESVDEASLSTFSAREPPPSHVMTFKGALKTYLEGILWFAAFKPENLKRLPFKAPRRAYQAWKDLDQYWNEILESKIARVREGHGDENLMSRLVLEAGIMDAPADSKSSKGPSKQQLSRSEVVGNAWVFMFAGHETTANSIEYSLLLLAAHRSVHTRVQQAVDAVVGDTPPSEWDYRATCDRLYNGILGAVINEQLRLLPPIINLPKRVNRNDTDKTIQLKDRTVVIPAGTFIHVNVYDSHRNPNYWPHKPSQRTTAPVDLNDFVPDRWLENASPHTNDTPGTDHHHPAGSNLFTPPRGAFIPFSDGQRACIGRRFAIVELVAVLAYIMRHYTVELATDAWVPESELKGLSAERKREVYGKAVDRMWKVLDNDLDSLFTLKIPKGKQIPVRLVARGKEVFAAG